MYVANGTSKMNVNEPGCLADSQLQVRERGMPS
jgi:hypothetical protein